MQALVRCYARVATNQSQVTGQLYRAWAIRDAMGVAKLTKVETGSAGALR